MAETSTASQANLTEDARISIIMHEYDTLREEMISKTNNYNQMTIQICVVLAGSVAGAAVLNQINAISFAALTVLIASLFLLSIVLIAVAVIAQNYDTRRISARVREIEADVNRRAGEALLRWETQYGWGGSFPRAR